MAARPGGPSTATGVSYQALAIARAILDVHVGHAEWVRAEAPEQSDLERSDLVPVIVDDFVVCRKGRLEFNQAKSNAPGDGIWTTSKLGREGILTDFKKQVEATPGSTCTLITPNPCGLFGAVGKLAQGSLTFFEFQANLPQTRARLLDELSDELQTGKESCYRLLRDWRVDSISFESLESGIRQVTSLCFANPPAACECLLSFATRAMQSGEKLDATAIRQFFDKTGVFDAPRMDIKSLIGAVEASGTALRSAKRDTNGVVIQREAVAKLIDWVRAPDGKVAVLLDGAGAGKTAALSCLMTQLEAEGYLVLAIKADSLPPFGSASELQDRLGLSDSIPSIVSALIAKGDRPIVLLDQVDALSAAMARDSSAIRVILDLVGRLQTIPNAKVVVSCREFDWRYDGRLHALRNANPTEFAVGQLSAQDVSSMLATLTLATSDVHPAMMALLRTPMHLDAFVQMIRDERQQSPGWMPAGAKVYTLQQLYEQRWSATLRKALDTATTAGACERVVEQLVREMSDRQELAVPIAKMGAADLQAMHWLCSEGLLVNAQRCVRFFHQTFFDFMAARAFVKNGTSLTDFLLKSDQNLFYRPLVRQVLEYLRATDRGAYFRGLPVLLNESGVRKHIKALVLNWLGQLPDPTPEELKIFEPLLSQSAGRARALGYMDANGAWFEMLGPARLAHWLGSLPEAEISPIVWYLRRNTAQHQDKVAELLQPFLGRSAQWNGWIGYCLSGIESGWRDSSAGLLRDVLADRASQPEWHWQQYALEDLAKCRPAEAATAIGISLNRWVPEWLTASTSAADAQARPARRETGWFPADMHGFWEAVGHVVKSAPGEFLEGTLRSILIAMEATCERRLDGYRYNLALWLLEKQEYAHSGWERLLWAFLNAAKALARRDPARLRRLATQMLETEFEPMQQVVAAAYASQGETFAPDAAAFLLADARRLELGVLSNAVLRSATLIQACSPFWPPNMFAQVESAICCMNPRQPKSTKEIAWHQSEVLELLSALDASKLSENGKNLLGQLQRKFSDHAPRSHVSIEAGFVGPPIPPEGIRRMGDESWLSAMRKYTAERQPRNGKPIGLSGGRGQLAEALKGRAKEDPERFFELADEKMDSSCHVDYVAAIITGLSEAGAPIENIEKLIGRFAGAIDKECVREVSSAIGKYAEKSVPDSLLKLLEKWALTGSADKGSNSYDLVTDGLNTERGGALWNLGAILLKAEPPQRAAFLDVAEKVIPDTSVAVRAVCIQFLTYAIPADPLRACEIFRRMVRSERELLRSGACADFVYRTAHKHSSEAAWAVKAMLADAEDDKARETGGRLACLAAFENAEMVRMRDRCLSGDTAMRKGAATVYAHNINSAKVWCRVPLPAEAAVARC
ncbi:MAG TPA: ATP-binding protein [Planctomycetota bacterium]|jgi:hypothetical protein